MRKPPADIQFASGRADNLRSIFAAIAVALMAVTVVSAPQPKNAPEKVATTTITPTPKLVEALRGSFDMSKNPRPFIGFMILDQKGNPYPSFWCGGNGGGTIVFGGKIDDLDESFSMNQTGSFTVIISHAARKYGMSDVLPAGAWIDGIGARPIKCVFSSFTEPVITAVRSGQSGGVVDVSVKCGGTVEVGDRKAPFSGTATLSFSQTSPAFNLCAIFQLPGKELGLLGSKGEGITATLYTASASVLDATAAPSPSFMADEGQSVKDEAPQAE